MNEYLLRYVSKETTHGAIMITAPWGSGKSYYIKNHFEPLLGEKCGKSCIIISLYSLHSIGDLSKAIIVDSTIKSIKPECDKGISKAGVVAKTICLGLLDHFNFNIRIEEEDCIKFVNSSDFSNKVLILEDVERTTIDPLELLGFVNNLTERDGIKVILITNEPEFKEKIQSPDPDSQTIQYNRIKEKSIYDTLHYTSATSKVIADILKPYDSGKLHPIISDENISDDILGLTRDKNISHINYRSVQHAVEKVSDLFENVSIDLCDDFLRHVFLSAIAYTLKKKSDDNITWTGNTEVSEELGTDNYQLFRFVYNYFCDKTVDLTAICAANESFEKQKQFEAETTELLSRVNIILYFHRKDEPSVESSLKYICNNTALINKIPEETCVKLYGALIAMSSETICEEDANRCKNIIRQRFDETEYTPSYWSGSFSFSNDEAREEWNQFKAYISNRTDHSKPLSSFSYTVETLPTIMNREFAYNNYGVLKLLDIDKFTKMVEDCTPEQIDNIRGYFYNTYDFGYSDSRLAEDLPNLMKLKEEMGRIKNYSEFDSVKKLQLRWFESNLSDCILWSKR